MQDNSGEEEPQDLAATPYLNEDEYNGSPHSNEHSSQEKFSRSKLQYEPDEEDMELRKKLLESKMARKKTEEDTKILMNRLMLLKNEEQKVNRKEY
jgi:hypothetical protein